MSVKQMKYLEEKQRSDGALFQAILFPDNVGSQIGHCVCSGLYKVIITALSQSKALETVSSSGVGAAVGEDSGPPTNSCGKELCYQDQTEES